MPLFEQNTRRLFLQTPLGPDKLLLEAFSGQEEVSRPFAFELALLSHDHELSPLDLVGKTVGFQVQYEEGESRHFHGCVASFTAGSLATRDLRAYHAQVVPWLWFLGKRRGCRIFQNLTVLAIAEKIFDELRFSDYDTSGVRAPLPKLEYCVQYRETDLEFLARLFEAAGIFYFFKHEEERHTLVLADAKAAWFDCAEKDVPFSAGTFPGEHVSRWEHRWQFRSGAWAHADYNFETPSTRLRSSTKTVVKLAGTGPFEAYDYPGGFADGDAGEALAQQRMEEEEAGWDVVEGSGSCRSFAVGAKFRLSAHECSAEEGQEYVLLALGHSARDTSLRASGEATLEYSNSFRCIPAGVAFRPPRVTRKPLIAGPQTAVVVGPKGEEIYTDKHGRVKVQFHWDREGQADEKSSCWIRVAQVWAGKNWGAVFHPRIGQEVVVQFLEGDPDRPLITGSVYNAEQIPPYELPANQTQTAIKSRSSKGGDPETFNELRFEDKKDAELVYFHAQKDQTVVVENDQSLSVGHDRRETVGKDRSLSVGANKSEDVAENKTVTVGKDASESIGKNRTEDVGESMTLTVGKDRSTSIGGGLTLSVSKDVTITIDGAQSEAVKKAHVLKAQKVLVQADDEITLKTGGASITLKKSGDISIKGSKVKIEGSGEVVLKGAKVTQN